MTNLNYNFFYTTQGTGAACVNPSVTATKQGVLWLEKVSGIVERTDIYRYSVFSGEHLAIAEFINERSDK